MLAVSDVEDEEAIAAFVQTALERDRFTVKWVGDGMRATHSTSGHFGPGLPAWMGAILPTCASVKYICPSFAHGPGEDVDKIVGLEQARTIM